MKIHRSINLSIVIILVLSSCVAKKKYAELQQRNSSMQTQLTSEEEELEKCEAEKARAIAEISALKATNQGLQERIKDLNNTNAALLNNTGDLATLSKKAAENLEKSLESMKEKDLQIKSLRDAVNKRDSVTLALVTSIKGALGNLNDQDIEVNVEKGVVFISISDKLLFTSGSYKISESAKTILGKIATIMKNKEEIDFMVEGHTDNVPIKQNCIADNWELSVLRATAVVKVLQEDFSIEPERMTAAGRSHYVPLAENTTDANKARNRRTRIVVLPKLDQFYDMVEKGMEEAKANSQKE
ncbi:MAG: OmpA family protein [Bacteroidota bacterium]